MLWSLVFLKVICLSFNLAHAQSFDGLKLSLPLRKFQVNSGFGNRTHPVTGRMNVFHTGIDLRARSDTVFAILPGEVVKVSADLIIGNYIIIAHGAYSSIYGHLSKSMVGIGSLVASGTSIAITGNTGRVTGEHLHFGIKHEGRFVDPLKCLYFFGNLYGNDLYLFLNDLFWVRKPSGVNYSY
ncbi:M23 family metallopeptidase [Pedobacter psychrodurus]|uniref:M23 family metallopeptidase n=1 Tax=Pedobacter psychrodurus TaxID=2530456 RepID=UPI00292F86B0|nr:M23 family metallopeptidase [Pedobacter psychrodurus]